MLLLTFGNPKGELMQVRRFRKERAMCIIWLCAGSKLAPEIPDFCFSQDAASDDSCRLNREPDLSIPLVKQRGVPSPGRGLRASGLLDHVTEVSIDGLLGAMFLAPCQCFLASHRDDAFTRRQILTVSFGILG